MTNVVAFPIRNDSDQPFRLELRPMTDGSWEIWILREPQGDYLLLGSLLDHKSMELFFAFQDREKENAKLLFRALADERSA